MNEIEKNHQETKQLTKQERRMLKKQRKNDERKSVQRKRLVRKMVNTALVILIAGGIIWGIGWYIATRPSLPPTTAQGHTEDMPQSHITDQPIPDSMQRHLLEHADGRGEPGVIIQYNCKKYSCEADLIQKLTDLVKQYPANVYLAPNDYDGRIILTKIGRREILENFDEERVRNFIK